MSDSQSNAATAAPVGRSRKLLGTIGKVVIVLAMLTYVVLNVQWQDSVVTYDAAGQLAATTPCDIVGAWDQDPVTVRIDGEAEVRTIDVGLAEGGGRKLVTPGLFTYIANLDPLWFILGALCYLVTLTTAASRWWWLLRVNQLRVGWVEALRFTWIGVFFNNVIPGQTGGDVVKALYIVKRCPDGRVEALMSVLVDRILGLGSLALLGAIVVLFQLDRFPDLAVGIWGVLLAVLGSGVVAFSRRLRRVIRLDQLLRRLPGKLSAPLMKVDHAVHFYRNHVPGMVLWLLVGTVNHAFTIGGFVLMGKALGLSVPIGQYFVLVPVALIGSAVPVGGPGGWGVRELIFGELFGRYASGHLTVGGAMGAVQAEAVMRTRGVALSVLYGLHATAWSLVGGLMLLLDRNRITREEFEAERELEEAEGAALEQEAAHLGEPTDERPA